MNFKDEKMASTPVILIPDRSIDKICGKTVPSTRKSDAGVLYVRQGALTK